MSFPHVPDIAIPPSEIRCEALTKPTQTYQQWRAQPHRCIREAKQGRDGRLVCNIHARVKAITYWQGGPDPFPWNVRHQRAYIRRHCNAT